jgi:hypothetical protein
MGELRPYRIDGTAAEARDSAGTGAFRAEFARDVLAGLGARPKTLDCK